MPKHYVVIPAAGLGQRMGARDSTEPLPKQYLRLGGKTLLEHCVAAFLAHPSINLVVVAVSPQDERARQIFQSSEQVVLVPCGGASRQETVLNALRWLEERVFAQRGTVPGEDSWVLVHDAARPGLSQEALNRLLEHALGGAGQRCDGAILALPIVDTLKRAHPGSNLVQNSPSRNDMWAAQTPQMFKLSQLKQALMHCSDRVHAVTDEASAMEEMGFTVGLVTGERRNLKVTVPEDMKWLEAIWMQ
jgi:2-C-methyl-D-erythritol 4-phosphate cytidylyltransferase